MKDGESVSSEHREDGVAPDDADESHEEQDEEG